MKSSMRLASLVVRYWLTSKPRTCPPMRTGNFETSKRVTGPMPLRPLRMASHAAATVLPTGETMPRPVTTTRRLLTVSMDCARRLSAGAREDRRRRSALVPPLVDVVDRLMHRGDLFRVLVRYLDLELLLERHHEFDRVQRVRAEIVDEGGVVRHLFLLDAQLLGDDGFYLLLNRAHYATILQIDGPRAHRCGGTGAV